MGLTILNRKPSQMQDDTVLSASKQSAEQLLLQLDLYEEAMLLDGQFEKKSFDPNSIVNVADRLEVLLDGMKCGIPVIHSLGALLDAIKMDASSWSYDSDHEAVGDNIMDQWSAYFKVRKDLHHRVLQVIDLSYAPCDVTFSWSQFTMLL
jgi:hypothetical protein